MAEYVNKLVEVIKAATYRRQSTKMLSLVRILLTAMLAISVAAKHIKPYENNTETFKLSIIHLNDFHARFDETSTNSGPCKESNCIGGFSRLYTVINNLTETRPNTIFLNAGDNFQGTFWYNLFKWNVTQYFLNMLPTDAITLGNHEFDDKIEGLVPFLKALKAPVVVSNIDDTEEPTMHGLYKKSVIVERGGKKIGVVGVILSTFNSLTSTGKLKFLDEVQSVNAEARRLLDEDGVFTVVVLSHCGYDVDQKIAMKAIPGISVVVGAHSHTLLYSGEPPNGVAYGEYPTVLENTGGKKTLVVQASAYSKYVGDITIDFDESGDLVAWEGKPIYLDKSIPQDERISNLLAPWRLEVEEQGNKVIGESKVLLDHTDCRRKECNFGNFIADAMADHYMKIAGNNSYAPIAFINSRGILASLAKGNITLSQLTLAQPFGSTIDTGTLLGKALKDVFELAAESISSKRGYVNWNLLQVSGIRVTIDLSKPKGYRVVSLKVLCNKCEIPAYHDLDPEAYYTIVTTSFLAAGGDGFTILKELRSYRRGDVDLDVILSYIKQKSPTMYGLDGRITFINNFSE